MRITRSRLHAMKHHQEKIAMLTAYDASFTRILNQAQVDIILVGDSLGMVIQGHRSTIPVTMDAMEYHTRCVSASNTYSYIMVDMPFMTTITEEQTMSYATRLFQAGAQMVKIEAERYLLPHVRALTERGLPVCVHLGLRLQMSHLLGRKIQGRDVDSAQAILDDAQAFEEAGAQCLLLECVPPQLAQRVTQALRIPVIGIGAGMHCDGQVLVLYDILGLFEEIPLTFTHNFLAETSSILEACQAYVRAVKEKRFPLKEHCFESSK